MDVIRIFMGALFISSPFIPSEYPRIKLEPPYGDVIRISMGAFFSSPFILSEYSRLKLEFNTSQEWGLSMGAAA